jgi:hypothetical protein
MAKNNKKWDGAERRKGAKPYSEGDRRKNNTSKVNADFVSTKNDERYQFENLVIIYRARFNVWQVLNMRLPSYEQLLFEVVGYAKQVDAFMWAKEYIKELKYNNGKGK